MVCHFQPSCSQRTSASSTCPHSLSLCLPRLNGYLLYYEQNIYELILIFLLLQMQPSTGDAEAAEEMGLQLGQMISKLQEHHLVCAISTFPIFWSRNLLRHFQYKL